VDKLIDLICCGAINWDINLFMERLPRTGEEVFVKEIQRVSGGTAANVSVTAARILGKNRVAFIGALGDDSIAEKQIKILEEEGVDTSGILHVSGEESGQAYISIDNKGLNEIHTYFGANLKIKREHLRKRERLDLISKAKVCVIMDPPIETAEEMAKICKHANITVIWDPGVYAEKDLKTLLPTLKNTDYLILNHLEFENLLGTSKPDEVVGLLNKKVKQLKSIIKKGSQGCLLCDTTELIEVEAVPLDKLGMNVLNTVGCGDAFIGAFASAKVEGLRAQVALFRATAAGSFKATRKETRGGPTLKELQLLLDRWNKL
jgi:ribokinase